MKLSSINSKGVTRLVIYRKFLHLYSIQKPKILTSVSRFSDRKIVIHKKKSTNTSLENAKNVSCLYKNMEEYHGHQDDVACFGVSLLI